MVTKTKIVNDTDSEIDLKEGNIGVYIRLKKLSKKGFKGSSHEIHVDPNATYREYWIAALADNTGKQPIVVTSDDCIDNSILTIKLVREDYVCEKTPRNAPRNPVANPHAHNTDNTSVPAKAGWKNFFSKWQTSSV